MRLGDQWSRKDYEYTIVAQVPHSSKNCEVYLIQKRKFGEEEVDYFVQEHEFTRPAFNYEGNVLD